MTKCIILYTHSCTNVHIFNLIISLIFIIDELKHFHAGACTCVSISVVCMSN